MRTATALDAPALLRHLLDDAAIFPPGNAPVAEALDRHAAHSASAHAGLVGAFVCSDARWAELARHLPADGRLAVALVVTGGPAAVGPAVEAALRDPRTRLAAVEVALPAGAPVAAAVAALEGALPAAVDGYVEVPLDRSAAPLELAGTPYAAKIRSGGTTAGAFPDEATLARGLHACLAAGVPCKLTAGLHGAVRHRDPATGFEHHGFLNVLLAVAAGLDGGDAGDLAGVLAVQDARRLAADAARLGREQADAVRRRFRSFGTCSIDEPVRDLRSLGLLPQEAA